MQKIARATPKRTGVISLKQVGKTKWEKGKINQSLLRERQRYR